MMNQKLAILSVSSVGVTIKPWLFGMSVTDPLSRLAFFLSGAPTATMTVSGSCSVEFDLVQHLGMKYIFYTHQSYTVLTAAIAVLRWPVVGPVALRGAAGLAFELARYPSNRSSLRHAMTPMPVDNRDRRPWFIEERWALAALAVALLRAPVPVLASRGASDGRSDLRRP